MDHMWGPRVTLILTDDDQENGMAKKLYGIYKGNVTG